MYYMKKEIWKYAFVFLIGMATYKIVEYYYISKLLINDNLENTLTNDNLENISLLSKYPVLKLILFILIIAISIYNIRRDIRRHKESTK